MGKEQLKDRLKNARKKLKIEKENPQTSNIGQAFKLSTELVAAVLVGTIIGFILDNWFDTKPWLIIIFFFVGVVAGILNVIRSAKKLQN
ncbi:AtpZ/AtpI family protein [Candidatus Pelagibacter communis]|uniref:AtpZ/AtpI family protein n=1 Tax=Pelagibacter ubique TaxID=198252 RepID=UPI00094CC14E|nr:AtpZ/AtpI family protein [Candidatus Pelagibacter ubique]